MLIDSDVYRNEALSVRSPLNVPRHFFHRPTGMLTYAMCVVAVGELSCESNPCVTFHRPAGTLRVRVVGRVAEDSTSGARQR